MGREFPRLVLNLKTYPEATRAKALALARAAVSIERRTGIRVALAPQAVDIAACVSARARVYAQHFDRVESSQSTGATRLESLVAHGVQGTLINHSERRLRKPAIAWSVAAARKAKIASVVCTRSAAESRTLAAHGPDLLAIEPPSLIGGDVSVTTADPGIVRRSVERVHEVAPRLPVLCGAGVKDGLDAMEARRLGAFGILVASGVVKHSQPTRALEALADGLARIDQE